MPIENEFSRPLHIERMAESGQDFELTARPAECRAVARRLQLDTLNDLTASGKLEPGSGGRLIRLSGIVRADCTQSCVLTMEPVETRVEALFERCFEVGTRSPAGEIIIDERDDQPEPLCGSMLDLGEIVVEELSLALDPYPRAADVPVPASEPAPAGANRQNPFAALAALRDRRD